MQKKTKKLVYVKKNKKCKTDLITSFILLLTYLKPDTYSEPSQKFKMDCFAKQAKRYNYFSKRPILDLW